MKANQGLFASGLILGLGLGFLFSHFLRSNSSPITTTLQAPVLRPVPFPSPELSPAPPLDDQALTEFDSELDRALEGLLPPDSPLQNALAMETAREADHRTTAQLVPIPPVEKEPEPLNVEQASPLTTNTPRDQETIREIIESELSHLPEEKRRVWFDALKDVKKEDVAGILRMWKLLGGPIPEVSLAKSFPAPLPGTVPSAVPPGQPAVEAPPSTEPVPSPRTPLKPDPDEQSQLVQKIGEILRKNELFRYTPGYIPRVPMIVQSPAGKLVVLDREDFSAVKSVETGFPLDLTIQGNGFFVVLSEEGTRYFTRRGHFSLDQKRRIVLPDGERLLVLQPEIILPEMPHAAELLINERGEVSLIEADEKQPDAPGTQRHLGTIQVARLLQGRDLQRAGNGLYVLPPEKQDHWFIPSRAQGTGVIRSGMIELPASGPSGANSP